MYGVSIRGAAALYLELIVPLLPAEHSQAIRYTLAGLLGRYDVSRFNSVDDVQLWVTAFKAWPSTYVPAASEMQAELAIDLREASAFEDRYWLSEVILLPPITLYGRAYAALRRVHDDPHAWKRLLKGQRAVQVDVFFWLDHDTSPATATVFAVNCHALS